VIYRIAFGVGDGTVRVWNLSNSTSLEITTLWQKIKGKVMAVSVFDVFFILVGLHKQTWRKGTLCMWHSVLLEKLIVTQLVRKSIHLV
jgi:hypothetical protein